MLVPLHGPKNVIMLEDACDRFISQHKANSSAPDRVEKHTRLKVRAIEFFGDVSLGSLTVDGISPLGDMGFRVAQHTEYVRAPPGILQLLRRARMD